MAIRTTALALVASAILTPGPARADVDGVLLVDRSSPETPPTLRRSVAIELARALRADGVLEVVLPTANESGPAQRVAELIAEAKELSQQFKETDALARLEQAEQAFREGGKSLTAIAPLIAILKARARLEIDQAQRTALARTLTRLAVVAPQLILDAGRNRPDIIAQFNRARSRVAGRQGTLRVRTTPPGQPVWIDGRKRGIAPVSVELPAGEHYVAAAPTPAIGAPISVLADRSASISVAASAPLDDNQLRSMGTQAGVGWVIALAVRGEGTGRYRLGVRLLNARTVSVARALRSDAFGADGSAEQTTSLASRIVAQLGTNAQQATADAGDPDSASEDKPVWRKWWFWTAVGALAVGGGVTAGVLATRDRSVQLRLVP